MRPLNILMILLIQDQKTDLIDFELCIILIKLFKLI